MSESYFVVEVNNEILGNSVRICSLGSLKSFNLVAYHLALRAHEDGQKHSAGMWTVYPYKGLVNNPDHARHVANEIMARAEKEREKARSEEASKGISYE